ncbi:MAG: hypothetical protein DRJ31_00350 [Candidatus Methanomethylicota archaeon]|uniref:ArsR family transcriptional regulator n=1 Tax=Thermoproteota archaeon TaxID=2056631 RepID=A0A497ETR9_9CREN|nr:MAG: hypothetical protein DRJ31_00350 [Candidatus Verstraetearchaeota archaeon]
MGDGLEDRLLAELKGTTLRVYLLLASRGEVSPREVQRALRMKSPSTAFYHLDKLVNLGIAEKLPGGVYVISKRVSIGPLALYANILGLQIPRLVPYAIFFTILCTGFLLFFQPPIGYLASLVAGLSAAIFWVESLLIMRSHRMLLSSKREASVSSR